MFNKELLKELEIFHMRKTRLVEDMCLFSNIIETYKEESIGFVVSVLK